LIEVRWHGRGGQGVVTSSELLARAALLEGKYVQHFPEFGPERRGAPVRAFTRISNEPIEIHTGIYTPDIVVVIDPTLLTRIDMILEGIKKGGTIVINAKRVPDKLASAAKDLDLNLYYVDAYTIAINIFKRPFYNTPMLGACVKATGLVKLDSVIKVTESKFKAEIAEKNIIAIKKAYEEVKRYE